MFKKTYGWAIRNINYSFLWWGILEYTEDPFAPYDENQSLNLLWNPARKCDENI